MDLETCRARILSEEYRDFIVPIQGGKEIFQKAEIQICAQGDVGGYQIVYVDGIEAEPLNYERFTYNSIPRCFGLLDMDAMNQAGIIQVQNYPTLSLMGQNVLLGFIDTGIDYCHPVFRNLDGSTRILGIWDQTIQTGSPPKGFSYGTEYLQNQIDEALQNENPLRIVPTVDENGHGTFLASLAAGGASEEEDFIGAAPESYVAMVKLKPAKNYLLRYYNIRQSSEIYQENDIMLGIKYLIGLAEEKRLPLVISIALGTNFGGHNGTIPLSVLLNQYAFLPNCVVVTGVGNESNKRHHYQGKINSMQDKKEVEIRADNRVEGFTMELWTDIPNLFTVSLVSPSGEKMTRISIREQQGEQYRFVFEQTLVYVEYRVLVERNNSQLIFFRFERPVEGIWKVVIEPVRLSDGVFHIWLPLEDFLSGEVYFLESDPNVTVVTPSATEAPMSVAYYNGGENSVDINSGRGYTRNGRIKPEIAAPGAAVKGALPANRFGIRSGSSVSVGIAAGAAALLLDWLYYQRGQRADTVQIKNLFILGARQRMDMEYPNPEWGYGTLDLYNVLQQIRQI